MKIYQKVYGVFLLVAFLIMPLVLTGCPEWDKAWNLPDEYLGHYHMTSGMIEVRDSSGNFGPRYFKEDIVIWVSNISTMSVSGWSGTQGEWLTLVEVPKFTINLYYDQALKKFDRTFVFKGHEERLNNLETCITSCYADYRGSGYWGGGIGVKDYDVDFDFFKEDGYHRIAIWYTDKNSEPDISRDFTLRGHFK